MQEYSFATPNQPTYIKGQFTKTNLHLTIDDWLQNINVSKKKSECVSSRSFQSLWHDHSFHGDAKMNYVRNLRHRALKGVSSYLDKNTLCSITMTFLFVLLINDISKITTNGRLTNICADYSMICESGDIVLEAQHNNCLNHKFMVQTESLEHRCWQPN